MTMQFCLCLFPHFTLLFWYNFKLQLKYNSRAYTYYSLRLTLFFSGDVQANWQPAGCTGSKRFHLRVQLVWCMWENPQKLAFFSPTQQLRELDLQEKETSSNWPRKSLFHSDMSSRRFWILRDCHEKIDTSSKKVHWKKSTTFDL